MPLRDPFKFSKRKSAFDTLHAALKKSLKHPFTGVTQGGSSRKFKGAKPAATTATVNQKSED